MPGQSGPKLPFDIQLCVLDWIIALGKAENSVDVSPCAAVCKTWQVIIERELFRHLTLTLKDLELFSKYCHGRKHYVKHILLEIWLCHDLDINMDKVCFTEATETLFLELSTWEGHGITLEFGIVPPSEPGWISYPKRSRSFHIHYGPAPRKRLLSGNLRDLDELKEFDWDGDRDLTNDDLSELWTEHGLDIQGHVHLTFNDDSDVGTSLLAKVACVSKLLIRRRYMPKINSNSLFTIIKSLPFLESIQLEQWCYGHHFYDDEWDSYVILCTLEILICLASIDLDNTAIALPESLKEFTYYEECGTNYDQRDGEEPHQLNPTFIDVLIKAADRIEHIAISFSASSLLNPNANFKFTALKTLAITSDALLHDMDGLVDLPLLRCAATAAKRMPKLEVFEIWCYKNRMALQAQVFTY
ncbi:unnamed protein product [Fusarium equiseti]|uniref:DUF6546 domain-containing protein n=1 Tax=Fusarium equiseti TaxID=61235 RepID=A0A8J2JB16_FUSEQ|nr:unnamed protein product [Fusarium equiseti]